jgi:Transglutaminase-like superfamily
VKIVRQLVPVLLVPLCVLANVLAAAPWLRSFPLSVAGLPIYGAAVLSVLVPILSVRLRRGGLWLALLIDVAVFVGYTLLIVLQDPSGLGDLLDGLIRGPSQVLTFALPLISPRSLMVAPVALTWLAGALAGECFARRWYTLLPYAGFLVAFGLAYAGTQRAAGSDAHAVRVYETVLGAALLATLLLLRVVQSWVRQDETAESTQPDGVLPLRGMVLGTVITLAVAVAAALIVQSSVFPKSAATPQRVPSVNESNPLTPMAFVAGLRPRSADASAQPVFTVRTDASSPGFFSIANVDFYDGSGWSFDRTFRPSGGVVPADADTTLRTQHEVGQHRVAGGPLTGAPWMPFLYRAQKVTGMSVNIDPSSGMIVPAGRLAAGDSYVVRSQVATTTFDRIKAASSNPDTATSTIDTQLPPEVRTTVDRLVNAFSEETGVPSLPALPFLQALQSDLRSRYSLSGAALGSGTSASPSSTSPSSASPSASRSSTAPNADLAGGTGFADVLASILGPGHNGTPEQFATLVALVARDLGVPARVATGFRVVPPAGSSALPAGVYPVTTADAWSWAEIPISGEGWVVLDGSPAQVSPQKQQTQSAVSPTPSRSAPPSQNALVTQANSGHAVAGKSRTPSSAAPKHALLIALLVVLGVLLVGVVAVLATRKRFRAARRRRAPDPRARLIGAWQESMDVLTEAGLPELTTLTSAEIAALTAEQFGTPSGRSAAALGASANAVAYHPSVAVSAEDADAAWTEQQALRKQVRTTLGVRERMTANLRYHRVKRVAAPVSPASWATSDAAPSARRNASPRERGRYRGRRRAH